MRRRFHHLVLVLCAVCALTAVSGTVSGQAGEAGDGLPLDLDQALEIALKNNHQRAVSKASLAIAEAQHKQALSGYWPRLDLGSTYTHRDEEPNFLYPAQTFELPGFSFQLPEQDIKLLDQDLVYSELELTYPLYVGGRRAAVKRQAEQGVEAARQEVRRTDLQVIYDVSRYYHGAILAGELHRIGLDALARLEATHLLTERLYTEGSGRVKKTDYLRSEVIVETARGMVAQLESNLELAKSALVNSMGLKWNTAVELPGGGAVFTASEADLDQMVSEAYRFSPDWARMAAAVDAAEAKVDEEQGGWLPSLVLFGRLNRVDSGDYGGLVTPENENSYAVGVALRWSLFDGFLTRHRIRESKFRLQQLMPQQVLLEEGIALQVKQAFLQTKAAERQYAASLASCRAAAENRSLNERAYRDQLVETKDVIEAQIMESMVLAQHQKTMYDHLSAKARLEFVIGREVVRQVTRGGP